MPRQTATTAKPLSVPERKALLRGLVKTGKLTERQAGLIDIREATAREKETGERLARERAHRKAA